MNKEEFYHWIDKFKDLIKEDTIMYGLIFYDNNGKQETLWINNKFEDKDALALIEIEKVKILNRIFQKMMQISDKIEK